MADAGEDSPADDSPVEVHGVLVCRGVQGTPSGGVDVHDVIDVLVVPSFPAEAGPLTFCAFVRAKRAGEADVSFRLYPLKAPSVTVATLPGRLKVQKGFEGRQSVIGSGFKTIRINQGGWYGVEFRVGETILARTRFAVGARAPRGAPPAAPPGSERPAGGAGPDAGGKAPPPGAPPPA